MSETMPLQYVSRKELFAADERDYICCSRVLSNMSESCHDVNDDCIRFPDAILEQWVTYFELALKS
jgi:hypothetical protein